MDSLPFRPGQFCCCTAIPGVTLPTTYRRIHHTYYTCLPFLRLFCTVFWNVTRFMPARHLRQHLPPPLPLPDTTGCRNRLHRHYWCGNVMPFHVGITLFSALNLVERFRPRILHQPPPSTDCLIPVRFTTAAHSVANTYLRIRITALPTHKQPCCHYHRPLPHRPQVHLPITYRFLHTMRSVLVFCCAFIDCIDYYAVLNVTVGSDCRFHWTGTLFLPPLTFLP